MVGDSEELFLSLFIGPPDKAGPLPDLKRGILECVVRDVIKWAIVGFRVATDTVDRPAE